MSSRALTLFKHEGSFTAHCRLAHHNGVGQLKRVAEVIGRFSILRNLAPIGVHLVFRTLNPAFIGINRVLSVHSRVLPRDFYSRLTGLHTSTSPVPCSAILSILTTRCKHPTSRIFTRVSPGPLNSTSLTRIRHTALGANRSITVGIRHPNIHRVVTRSISVVHSVTGTTAGIVHASRVISLGNIIRRL